MLFDEYIYSVTCNIKINGVSISCKTWTSLNSYDVVYDKINDFIRKNKKPDDVVVKDIISANHKKI